jgi:hypothetical protein
VKKNYEKNNEPDAREKVIVNGFLNGVLTSDLWTTEQLWAYMRVALSTGYDPLDIMFVQQNEYALGRAEVFGLNKERKIKYGRD